MDAIQHLNELIRFDSVSSKSNVPITEYVERLLKQRGFEVERLEYDDKAGVRKASVVAKLGTGTGGMAYFGHTDVVPASPWFTERHGPFEPTIHEGKLYGRGSCDMKGSVACVLAAVERIRVADLKRPVYITCTADEEVGYGGAESVAKRSILFREMIAGDAKGIIGEPTHLEVVYAHKGTFGFLATSIGKASHSSTREGLNANLAMIPFLVEMKAIHDEVEADPAWQHPEFDPPTISWNIGINDHTHALNITAPQSVCSVYYRPMPGQNPQLLLERARQSGSAVWITVRVPQRRNALVHGPEIGVHPRVGAVGRSSSRDNGRLRHRRRDVDGTQEDGGAGSRTHQAGSHLGRVD